MNLKTFVEDLESFIFTLWKGDSSPETNKLREIIFQEMLRAYFKDLKHSEIVEYISRYSPYSKMRKDIKSKKSL